MFINIVPRDVLCFHKQFVAKTRILNRCDYPTSNIYWKWEGFVRFHMTITKCSPAHY